MSNPIGLNGIEFIEFSSGEPNKLHQLFFEFGFSKTQRHSDKAVDLYNQNDIHFLLNTQEGSFASQFHKAHGPCISSMGWRVQDAKKAQTEAIKRGASECKSGDYKYTDGTSVPSIYGIGESLIYFIDKEFDYSKIGFRKLDQPVVADSKGFETIDHLTNNVPKGTMEKWSNFYKDVFGFTEVRYFDIRGAKTGLTSYALKSPCGKFCIPINEGTEHGSQINEYLREYNGPGVQHLALTSGDILTSLEKIKGSSIQMLDIDDEYYKEVFDRVPNVTENHKRIQDLNVLVDGDEEGYLLQIFTKNLIGPIFIEIIQRKNHHSFGEGNFGALFRSIERDQEKRGVL